jgi:hypothetical protein
MIQGAFINEYGEIDWPNSIAERIKHEKPWRASMTGLPKSAFPCL